MDTYDRIRIVLVETSHPGNIGAAARAMKTMGLSRLYLVSPSAYPHADATARAAGADDILSDAEVVASLSEALRGCSLSVGTSARERTVDWPRLGPRQCGQRLADEAEAGREAALVFGRERTGLNNEELDLCQFQVQIPSNPAYSSLNLAAAVQVLSYELRLAIGEAPRRARRDPADVPARFEEVEALYQALEDALVAWDFLDPDNPRHLMRRLRRLFGRAGLTRNEVNILRGILSAARRSGG